MSLDLMTLKAGDRIVHTVLGPGSVVGFGRSMSGIGAIMRVHFDRYPDWPTKDLLLDFCAGKIAREGAVTPLDVDQPHGATDKTQSVTTNPQVKP